MNRISACLALMALLMMGTNSIITNNICTFRTDGKLFSLTYLQLINPYKIVVDSFTTVYLNFCFAFVPPQCPNQPTAFSFVVTLIEPQNQTLPTPSDAKYICERYSSNSTTTLFQTEYQNDDDGVLELMLYTNDPDTFTPQVRTNFKQTKIHIECSERSDFFIQDFDLEDNGTTLQIEGNSKYGCPVFQTSSIWQVFQNNQILFGIVLFILGFYLLFFGRATIDITVFIAVFFISFAGIGSILTLFISPNSSTLTIYMVFLILLFVCCILGYASTKLISVSVFFVGAFLGFILGILFSSIFSKMFNIYALWPIIVFVLLFSIPLGLLTFKYHDQVIIASSAFTGAYLIVRPFSWIFGGFPNELLLYKAVNNQQIADLPWTFFIYLLIIIILAIVGGMYQQLKLNRHRQKTGQQIQVNFVQNSIEAPIDAVKVYVDKIIDKFKTQQPQDHSQYHQIQPSGGENIIKQSSSKEFK